MFLLNKLEITGLEYTRVLKIVKHIKNLFNFK